MRVHKGGKGLTIRMCACFPLSYAWTATIRCYISQGKSRLHFIVQMSTDPIIIRPNEWWTCKVLMRHWKLWNRKSTLWTDAKNLHRTLCCARTFISEPPCFPFEGDLTLCTLLLSYFLQKLLSHLIIIMIIISTIISVVGSRYSVHYSDRQRQGGLSFMYSSILYL